MDRSRRTVAVVGGCGQVGLALSIALARHNRVYIYDIDESAVATVRSGRMPFKEEGAEENLAAVLGKSLSVSTEPSAIPGCGAVVLIIGTPVDEHVN